MTSRDDGLCEDNVPNHLMGVKEGGPNFFMGCQEFENKEIHNTIVIQGFVSSLQVSNTFIFLSKNDINLLGCQPPFPFVIDHICIAIKKSEIT